ncbi:tRNA pseudouridine synthase B [Microbacterium mangrovi]|uniref:tRNA pseudouridine synthase B n=1 Tax=Microbacterium mangrovi TaxID=1348253 RepID=A0A0B2A3R7_9MICO|nr:tRNA pseudouridine(55) synthase TruB [Microbacterium mangrovi]KHK96208.1 tRNA pseudouridine synthase B [Microbacterium mangrovi]
MGPSGILLVDKAGGMTSHDVVARARRALKTKKIGHAGTLDPMATGLLILGVGPATRLLTFIVGLDKTYEATIRLGVSTDSDDADGEVTRTTDAAHVADAQIEAGIARLRGPLSQVPSTVSAIKVGGRRAYDLARQGEEVQLKARDVVISRFEVLGIRRTDHAGETAIDVDVVVDCSSGTYIRALARDLGADLGAGGHLTALRRTHVGPFAVADAQPVPDRDRLEDSDLGDHLRPPAEVAASVLGGVQVTAEQARDLRHGKRIALPDAPARAAAIAPDGSLIGVVERRGPAVKSVMNMPEPESPEQPA